MPETPGPRTGCTSRAWLPASKKEDSATGKKPLSSSEEHVFPHEFIAFQKQACAARVPPLGLRTSDNRCKRELLSLQKHISCRDAVTSVNCFRLLFEAPECRCPPKPLSNRLAVPAANAQHTPQPRCNIAKNLCQHRLYSRVRGLFSGH